MPKKNAIAVLCSDWHLSHKPPLLRSEEPDWYERQRTVAEEVRDIADRNNCPIFFAGDLFHTWNSPPELINFALAEVPRLALAIPGQHDMPNHNHGEMRRSAFYTWEMWQQVNFPYAGHNIDFSYFPFGTKLAGRGKSMIDLALVHQYCWNSTNNSYPGAPIANHAAKLRKALPNYRVIAVGDNHCHFIDTRKKPFIVNCGCMMRRSSTELRYEPSVTLWFEGDTFERVKLDTSHDWYLDPKYLKLVSRAEDVYTNAAQLAEELKALGNEVPDFFELVEQVLSITDASKRVRQFTLRFLNDE